MKNMMKDIKSVLIDKERLDARVAELGRQITEDYQGRDVVLVGILKGAMPFLCDLMRSIDLPVTLDTMCVSSYGSGTVSSGSVNIKKDLDKDIRGKDVIVVEDCLDKKERRVQDVPVKYMGFEVPDEFIVGYGCDYAEKYRNLPEVCTLKSEVYTRA